LIVVQGFRGLTSTIRTGKVGGTETYTPVLYNYGGICINRERFLKEG